MIDPSLCFRRGKSIVVVDVDDKGEFHKTQTDYKSVNQAKKANRATKYRVIKTKVTQS